MNNSPIAILRLIIEDPPKLMNGKGTPVNGIVPEIHGKIYGTGKKQKTEFSEGEDHA